MGLSVPTVSYTHLDVYKRQAMFSPTVWVSQFCNQIFVWTNNVCSDKLAPEPSMCNYKRVRLNGEWFS